MQLTEALISLNAQVRDKQAAIVAAANLLVENGKVSPEYLEGMYERETQANTYLGNGIAIPHGSASSKKFIKETAISVLQIPGGIIWGEQEELVHIVIAIAASSDEHLAILRRLTRVLNQDDLVKNLINTQNKSNFLSALNSENHKTSEAVKNEVKSSDDGFFHGKVIIPNPLGFHARPATNLSKLVKNLGAKVFLQKQDGTKADANKLISLLSLSLSHGTEITVIADKAEHLKTIINAIESGLGDDLNETLKSKTKTSALWQAEGNIKSYNGICAAEGLVLGTVYHYKSNGYTISNHQSNLSVVQEIKRFQDAIISSEKDIIATKNSLTERLSPEQLEIFDAHLALLLDDELLEKTVESIYRGSNSESAYFAVANEQIAVFERLTDAVLAARAADMQDVRDRVIRKLLNIAEGEINFPENTILCADDLTPSNTAKLDPSKISAFVTHKGGPNSHSAILARGMGIAALVGVNHLSEIDDGTQAIVDANAGKIYLNPNEAQLNSVQKQISIIKEQEEKALQLRHLAGTTADGRRIEIAANVNNPIHVSEALDFGAEGVGLMRTEFLYLEQNHIPDEEQQFQIYSQMAEALGDKPLIIRTLDIGGDKYVPYLNLEKEENSFLGMRGIRLCLKRPDLFEPQIKAICRAAQKHNNIKVMFPMIATMQDWQAAKAKFQTIAANFKVNVPLGIMIEVPSAALIAHHLAKEVAFFSVGTNDLTQYVLAMDRMNPELAKQTDALHPAVLNLIAMTAKAAQENNIFVGVCGGAAGDAISARILVGLGVTELSVSAREVAKIKEVLRAHTYNDLKNWAKEALLLADAAAVRQFIKQKIGA